MNLQSFRFSLAKFRFWWQKGGNLAEELVRSATQLPIVFYIESQRRWTGMVAAGVTGRFDGLKFREVTQFV